eukprot:845287-Pyramimonas_sp.AAC.1
MHKYLRTYCPWQCSYDRMITARTTILCSSITIYIATTVKVMNLATFAIHVHLDGRCDRDWRNFCLGFVPPYQVVLMRMRFNLKLRDN